MKLNVRRVPQHASPARQLGCRSWCPTPSGTQRHTLRERRRARYNRQTAAPLLQAGKCRRRRRRRCRRRRYCCRCCRSPASGPGVLSPAHACVQRQTHTCGGGRAHVEGGGGGGGGCASRTGVRQGQEMRAVGTQQRPFARGVRAVLHSQPSARMLAPHAPRPARMPGRAHACVARQAGVAHHGTAQAHPHAEEVGCGAFRQAALRRHTLEQLPALAQLQHNVHLQVGEGRTQTVNAGH